MSCICDTCRHNKVCEYRVSAEECAICSYAYTTIDGDNLCQLIDNAPTVETKFELKTENGITYPKALDNMTFSHILSVEERQNIIQAYMLGANATARPQGKWITIHKQNSFGQDCICFECDKCHKYKVPIYKLMITEQLDVCPNCGADMRKGK